MSTRFLFFISTIIFPLLGFSQTNYQKFIALYDKKEKDTNAINKLLKEWENTNSNDPEFYTSAFNYYFSQSKEEIVSLQTEKPKGESFTLTDEKGKIEGYMGSDIHYNGSYIGKALKYINTAIEKFPNRLDIRFGKCYVLGELEEYEQFTKEIVKVVEYSNKIDNKWLWTENKPENKEMMIGSIFSYMKQFYNTGNDSLLRNIILIGKTTLKYYPKEIEILSTTAVSLLLLKQYDEAISYLEIAEKENPKDIVILNNIAHGYKLKGDKVNSAKYYELIIKYGDSEEQARAKNELEKLK